MMQKPEPGIVACLNVGGIDKSEIFLLYFYILSVEKVYNQEFFQPIATFTFCAAFQERTFH